MCNKTTHYIEKRTASLQMQTMKKKFHKIYIQSTP